MLGYWEPGRLYPVPQIPIGLLTGLVRYSLQHGERATFVFTSPSDPTTVPKAELGVVPAGLHPLEGGSDPPAPPARTR